MTDSNQPPSREEFQRLRETVAAQSEVIKNYLPDDPQKRKFLGEAAKGLGAVGALGIAGRSGYAMGEASAQASTSDSDVDIGSPNNRHDVFADGVDANSFGDVNATTVSADDLSVTNAPYVAGEVDDIREEHGTVTHADPGTASSNAWDTFTIDTQSISFSTAFSTSPKVFLEDISGSPGAQHKTNNKSTTGFDSQMVWYRSDTSVGRDADWFAIGDE